MQISKKFEQGIEQHTYQRLDSDYKVNLFLGYNEDGKMSMVITEPGQVVKTKSSKMIDVQMSKREDGKIALTFDLLDNAYASMFTIFCKDMILVCEKAGKEMAISNAVVRWKYWLELFGKKKGTLLDKSEIKGLIGELLILKDKFIPEYGVTDAIASWMGPMLGHKDFEIADTWYEVKAVNENAMQVNISSIEQLESDEDGHLVISRLEECSTVNKNAIFLNELVISIIEKIDNQDALMSFRGKLENVGYYSDPSYDEYAFGYKGMQMYRITDGFPRIRRKDLPLAVGNAKYTILLDGIAMYREE